MEFSPQLLNNAKQKINDNNANDTKRRLDPCCAPFTTLVALVDNKSEYMIRMLINDHSSVVESPRKKTINSTDA